MTAPTVRAVGHRRLSRAFAYGGFAIMVGGWLAFLVALVVSRPALDDVWTTVRDLPLIGELAVWLLGFPFLAGLAIWQAPWDETPRLVAIAALAGAYILMFRPRSNPHDSSV
jgi:hypothetical protein